MRAIRFSVLIFTLCISQSSAVEDKKIGPVTKLPLPRFASLKSNETNLRSGPAHHYPIKFTYKQKHYPIEIIAEFEHWRLLRDHDNEQGWVHQSLVSGVRYVMIKNNQVSAAKMSYKIPLDQAIILRLPDETSYPIIRAEIGVMAKLKKCIEKWCQIELDSKRGWIKKSNLWGVYTNEIID
jgi:SH3-like domain-containing protein